MYLANLTTNQLTKAHEAANYLLSLPAQLDIDLAIKLDTFRADTNAQLEDRGAVDSAAVATTAHDLPPGTPLP
jgi:hypothetical protein